MTQKLLDNPRYLYFRNLPTWKRTLCYVSFLHLQFQRIPKCSFVTFSAFFFYSNRKGTKTRVHSSRMRTLRCSGRLAGVGVSAQGWCLVRVGGLPRGCLPRGLYKFLTHACENITLPQILYRTVINTYKKLIIPIKIHNSQ